MTVVTVMTVVTFVTVVTVATVVPVVTEMTVVLVVTKKNLQFFSSSFFPKKCDKTHKVKLWQKS